MATAMLKKDEELRLARDWKDTGSHAAVSRLVTAYKPLILSIASRYMRQGISRDDLFQEGQMGFLSALNNFDPDRGNSVGTLARFHIEARMQIHVNEFAGTLRLPNSRRIKGLLTKCVALIRQAENEAGRELSNEEKDALCKAAGFRFEELQDFERAMRPARSLSTPVGNEDEAGFELADETAGPRQSETSESLRSAAAILAKILDDFPERTRRILVARHMSDDFVPLEDVAAELGLSRERVRRIEIEALFDLRARLEEAGISDLSDVL